MTQKHPYTSEIVEILEDNLRMRNENAQATLDNLTEQLSNAEATLRDLRIAAWFMTLMTSIALTLSIAAFATSRAPVSCSYDSVSQVCSRR